MNKGVLLFLGLGAFAIASKKASEPGPRADNSVVAAAINQQNSSSGFGPAIDDSTARILINSQNAGEAIASLSRNVNSPFAPGSPNFVPPDLSENGALPSQTFTPSTNPIRTDLPAEYVAAETSRQNAYNFWNPLGITFSGAGYINTNQQLKYFTGTPAQKAYLTSTYGVNWL